MYYVAIYKTLRKQGNEDNTAFALVASEIARRGKIEDLKAVEHVYMQDFLNDCEKLFTEVRDYENNQTDELKAN